MHARARGALPVARSDDQPTNTNSALILLVEDDTSTRESLCEILEHEGYSVLAAENGKRALECVETAATTPVLILLDLAMPVMDGFGFVSQIPDCAKLASVPVIVMSADSRASQLRLQRPENVKEILSKPVDLRLMMELVGRYAQRSQTVARSHAKPQQGSRSVGTNPSNLR